MSLGQRGPWQNDVNYTGYNGPDFHGVQAAEDAKKLENFNRGMVLGLGVATAALLSVSILLGGGFLTSDQAEIEASSYCASIDIEEGLVQ